MLPSAMTSSHSPADVKFSCHHASLFSPSTQHPMPYLPPTPISSQINRRTLPNLRPLWYWDPFRT